MVAVAAEVPIRGADAVPAAEREAVRAAAAEAAAKGGEGESGKEEVRYYASDIRKLEELFSKLNPSAEEFVPPSRRRVDGGARRLSADAPVFVSPAIDYYARHHQLPPPPLQQQQPMHVLQFVGGVGGGGMGGGGGRDSSSDGSVNGQPNRRRRNGFIQGRRRMMGGRPRRSDREDSVRRTVYVSDIDQHVTEQKLAEVFSTCGQVVDCRICGDPNSVLRFAFIEFADDVGAQAALALGGTVLGFYPVKVLPSKTAILPVNPKFLPRTEDEKEMVSRTVYCTNIDKKGSCPFSPTTKKTKEWTIWCNNRLWFVRLPCDTFPAHSLAPPCAVGLVLHSPHGIPLSHAPLVESSSPLTRADSSSPPHADGFLSAMHRWPLGRARLGRTPSLIRPLWR